MHLQYLVPGLILVVLSACSLGGDVDGYVSPYGTTPTADPGYDASNAGVYRGVLVGSQGIFQIYIANEPGVYEAHLQFDDSNCTLSTDYFDGPPDWTPGDQLANAVFQGTFPDDGSTWANEAATIDFSVGPTGLPTINSVTINGHSDPIIAVVYKERSDQLVLQYVGRAYDASEDPWADWGLLVVCPEGSQDITVKGYMIDISDPNDWWDIQASTSGDGVTGVIFNDSGGVTPIEGQTPTVDLTGLYDGQNPDIPNVKIHGEFDTTKWPDRMSGWWKSYFGPWGSDHIKVDEGEWDSERTTAPPVQGGIRINITGYPQSFFNGRTCRYAICQLNGDPNNPAERTAEGTIDLVSGSGVSEVAGLANGQYDLYVAVDVDGDGFTFSDSHPFDGDLHDAEMKVSVDGTTEEEVFTLQTVTGKVYWTDSLSGDVYVVLCSHVAGGFEVKQQVTYLGVTNATSAAYAIDATNPDLGGGPYYLLGVVTPPGGNLDNAVRTGWYAGASATEGTETEPVNLYSLQDSYDFDLAPLAP